MAIDRNLIAEQLYGFAGQAICNVIPAPLHYLSTANDSCLTQDIDGANALLDENGVVDSDGDGIREYNGMPLTISYQTSTNSVRQKTQALIRQWWSQIGIETELINHSASVFFGGRSQQPRHLPEVLHRLADVHHRPQHRPAAASLRVDLQPDPGAGERVGRRQHLPRLQRRI